MDWVEIYIDKLKTKFKGVTLRDVWAFLVYWIKKSKWLFLLIFCLWILQLYRHRLRFVILEGYGMGRPYKIQYWIRKSTRVKPTIDSLLVDLEKAIDLETDHSPLQQFNQYGCQDFALETPFLYPLLAKSKEVYSQTQGALDPTVAPLVRLWKSHLLSHSQPTESDIVPLLDYVGLDYVVVNPKRIKKLKEGVMLDLTALAHGYAVDTVVAFLKEQGAGDLWVKIGDEMVANGMRDQEKTWQVKEVLAAKQENIAPITLEITLSNKALAIAKNKDYWGDADQPSVIVNPKTGYLAQNELIAAVVFAPDAITADAYATAMLSQGLAFAQNLIENQKSIEALLIYQTTAGQTSYYASTGLVMSPSKDYQLIKLSLAPTNKASK